MPAPNASQIPVFPTHLRCPTQVLMMLHKKRTTDPEARQPAVQQFLERLRASRSFYYTPPGSNDDWYWLYATVKAKVGGNVGHGC